MWSIEVSFPFYLVHQGHDYFLFIIVKYLSPSELCWFHAYLPSFVRSLCAFCRSVLSLTLLHITQFHFGFQHLSPHPELCHNSYCYHNVKYVLTRWTLSHFLYRVLRHRFNILIKIPPSLILCTKHFSRCSNYLLVHITVPLCYFKSFLLDRTFSKIVSNICLTPS